MKRALFVLIALAVLAAGTVFAQNPNKIYLTIQSNQIGAQVYINDRPVGSTNPNFSYLVQQGQQYTIRVSKEGYPDFKTTVNVGSAPITVIANFGPGSPPLPPLPPPPPPTTTTTIPLPPPPPRFSLTVKSNAPGSQVFINGTYAGNAPFSTSIAPGSYALTVRAEGYSEFRQNIIVNGTITVTASLFPLGYDVGIDSPGVRGADVYRNSTWVGTTPYRDTWSPGYYSIAVTASGYTDFHEDFTLSGPKYIKANLQPSSVPYEIRLPESLVDRESKGFGRKQFRILIDENQVFSLYGSILPGRHTFSLEIGSVSFDSTFQVLQGKPCIIEPNFTIAVTQ